LTGSGSLGKVDEGIMQPYELMYILSSGVTDEEVEKIADEITAVIQKLGGVIEHEERMGRKKLAYPIRHTRNGFYVLVVFSMEPGGIAELESRIRTTPAIIRHLIVNVADARARMARDHMRKQAMRVRKPGFVTARSFEAEMTPIAEPIRAAAASEAPSKPIDIEQEIEKALESKDITK
jgi:small subunit ribosomal protein S6